MEPRPIPSTSLSLLKFLLQISHTRGNDVYGTSCVESESTRSETSYHLFCER